MKTPEVASKTTITDGSRVRFCLDETGDTFIDVRIENGKLVVRGTDALLIRPGAANSVNITMDAQ